MAANLIRKIVILGAGNVATNLVFGLRERGFAILQVFSRTRAHAEELAETAGCEAVTDPGQLSKEADIFIISVTDSAIREVADAIKPGNILVVHTSGMTSMDILSGSSKKYGVLYSPQTFTKADPGRLDDSPWCIEANDEETTGVLKEFASAFAGSVHLVSSEQRKIIHTAAVFANNFSNFMYTIAHDLLEASGMPFELLQPIIRKTARNAGPGNPFLLQTGPAFRGDLESVGRQLELLSEHPDFREIYEIITRNILKYKNLHEQL